MSKGKARVFVPLTKVDEEQRLVYGTITQEVLDKSGEMMDYAKSKPHFEKWSNDIHEASGGLSKGNLRVMHGLSVAGKLTELEFNDNDQSIEVCSKVVDDNEWNKVLEGCYTGFSVGGKYGKKWNETIDGEVVRKYEAIPNEVSLVDNPCVPSATFSLVKADGAEEQVMFKAAAGPDEDQPTDDGDEPVVTDGAPSNEDVAKRATELAKAANDGTTWIDHIETARTELTKAVTGEQGNEEQSEVEQPAAEDAGDQASDENASEGDDAAKADTAIIDRLSQKWETSDGKTFEKKADAAAHEASLVKSEPTEAEKLRARLEKATSGPGDEDQEELPLFEDFDRLGKTVEAIITPFENGEPKLEKGMYTVNRFSNVLSDMASLSRCIKSESQNEGENDAEDASVSADILAAVKSLGKSFIAYAQDQVTELLAGLDDDVVVACYDYYYCAAQADPENGLAKDVCEAINSLREPAAERRDDLIKGFGFIVGQEVVTDELSPPMQKRFDQLTAENEELRKVATDAVTAVEELTKRVDQIAEQPLPRAPRDGSVALKHGDAQFMGKSFSDPNELMKEVHDLIKTRGADAVAMELIKASQNGGGQRLHLSR